MPKYPSKKGLLSSNLKPALGEILVEAGLVSMAQIEFALQEQKQKDLRIGEILASHDWIKQETADFFAEQWSEILQEPEKQPLADYFCQAGLLSEKQIQTIVAEQGKNHQNFYDQHFYDFVIEKGYLKPVTVEFFLAHIFKIPSSQRFSFSKPYEMLREYIKGKTDFTKIDCHKGTFNGLTLKAVKLDCSNLRDADLSNCNLANSSMVKVNLAEANLRKTILTGANLERSLMFKADCREAHLEKVNFKNAMLQRADFSDAYLWRASFAGADLRGARFSPKHPYLVYYDHNTNFDANFNPKRRGWRKQSG